MTAFQGTLPAADERDQERILDAFCRLVRIDSPSGQEGAIAEYLESELRRLGLDTWRDGAGNVLGRLAGRGRGAARPWLLLSAHMDTVQPGCGIQPQVVDGVVRSDGTTILGADDKAGIAAILEALGHVVARGLEHRPLEVVFTVQEETGLSGSKALDMATLRARQAVVLDSNGPVGTIINQAPASDSIEVVVRGKAAHAGVAPELGINALQAVAQALASMRLGRIDAETTANFGVISGGTATNVVPDRVVLKGEARSRSESKLVAQTEHMVGLLRRAADALGAQVEASVRRSYGAYDIPESAPLIQEVSAALRACGLEPRLQPSGGGSDANVFNAAGIEAVNLGVGYTNPHSVDEQLAVADLLAMPRVVLALLLSAGR
jgi:tripeptide aminopeptidase